MKKIWILTLATVTLFEVLTSRAEAQPFGPGNMRPSSGPPSLSPIPGIPRTGSPLFDEMLGRQSRDPVRYFDNSPFPYFSNSPGLSNPQGGLGSGPTQADVAKILSQLNQNPIPNIIPPNFQNIPNRFNPNPVKPAGGPFRGPNENTIFWVFLVIGGTALLIAILIGYKSRNAARPQS